MQPPPCLQLALVKVLEGYLLPAGVTCVFFVFLHRKRGIEVVQVSTDRALAIVQVEGACSTYLPASRRSLGAWPLSTCSCFNFSFCGIDVIAAQAGQELGPAVWRG